MTTGLYPQSLIISFPQSIEIKSIKLSGLGSKISILYLFGICFLLLCNQVRQVIIEKSSKSNPVDFEVISEKGYLKTQSYFKPLL